MLQVSSSSSLSTTTSRVAKSTSTSTSSQRLHHVTSSSSTSEMKAHALKRDLSDIKNSMSEINNLASMGRTQINSNNTAGTLGDLKLSNSSAMSQLQQR